MTIHLLNTDITQLDVDAIVNAANESLLAGGGVCGAIHRAAGPELEEACRRIGHCPTGCAVLTSGYELQAGHVIHAVGPRWWDGTRGEAELLERCYRSIFEIVEQEHFRSVAIPAISTGIYGYPLDLATDIAVRVASAHDTPERNIVFACFGEEALRVYQQRLNEQKSKPA